MGAGAAPNEEEGVGLGLGLEEGVGVGVEDGDGDGDDDGDCVPGTSEGVADSTAGAGLVLADGMAGCGDEDGLFVDGPLTVI